MYTENLAGAPDFQIASACRTEARALLTLDLDFANIAAYPPHEHSGIIVLRPHSQSVTLIHALIEKNTCRLNLRNTGGGIVGC